MELPNNPRSRSLASTPASSPGLFRPSPPPTRTNTICLSDGTLAQSPYLHPLQMHKVKETHKAQVEQDFITGRKLINQYEIIDEIGRGVHGKVKRARSLETNEFVAIKIIQRFSKKRRLGKVTATPEDKTKREIAILKKIRHANVVGLIEVIDDPEFKKIYMVLEHVELGEILWRKKGTPQICLYERRRVEREMRGEADTGDDERFFRMMERRRLRKEAHRARASTIAMDNPEYWSLEHGDDTEDEVGSLSRHSTHESYSYLGHQHGSHLSMARSDQGAASASRGTSRAPSRTSSKGNGLGSEWEIGPGDSDDEEDPANMTRRASLASLPLSHSTHSSGHGFESHFLGMQNHEERQSFRGRSPSMADSIISHMSSVDDVTQHDIYEEDFSYVPCLTLEQARTTFRDVVLGLEYLHFEGIVHRDIKPANLLWTKEHHVKISDFGVSYFGRPVRAGEAEENVSEADATDFDDDLELAKTVGTPAFFAPELCYTDLDAEQPKVGKEIDIWSLGVTLYCLVFARIPFLAEDEYQLFRTIAQQDVYIPKQRLKPVNPSRTNSRLDLRSSGASKDVYREDAELALEDVDDELRDLIAGMLRKDPKRRISLRQVKWHPWTVKDITNVVGWIDDTDPGRVNAGGKIEVDDSDLDRAVVPLTFLERARSAVKKAVGKVIGRSEGSRRRAVSNATSSGGDFSHLHSPVTPGREGRRASLRGDESYFAPVREAREHVDHPLAQSVTASPVANDNGTFGVQLKKEHSSSDGDLKRRERPGPPDRTVSTAASIQTVIHRGHSHSKSVSGSSPPLQASSEADEYLPPPFAVFTDHKGNPFSEPSIKISRGPSSPGAVRTRSVERPLFVSSDKHGKPSIALSGALAPGSMDQPDANLDEALRSSVSSPLATDPPQLMPSPYFRRPSLAAQQSLSSPNVSDRIAASLGHHPRSSTTTHTPEGKTPVERNWPQSTQESFAKAQAILVRRRHQEAILEMKRKQDAALAREANRSQPSSSCPPSPDDDDLIKQQEIEANRKKSSSTVDSYDQTSPITSPSDMISPLSITNLDASQNQSFASHPSLPTLVSGASSVSADAEGDFLSHPGTVKTMETISSGTPDTMTPPALSKESTIDETASPRKTEMADPDDEEGYNADRDRALVTEDDDSDDSDEGLTMGRRSKPLKKTSGARRDTNISICSTETAKKVSMNE